MRRMGLSCQRELYVCIVNNLGMSKFKFAEVPSSETLIYNLCMEVRTDMNQYQSGKESLVDFRTKMIWTVDLNLESDSFSDIRI